jgi:Cu-processing system permease protein
MNKMIKYILTDILKNKMVIAYTLVLFVLSISIFTFEDNAVKGVLSLLSLLLFIIPLVSVIFSTIYLYNSSEFIELLASQPLKRQSIWLSMFSGLALALCLAFMLGVGIPVLIYAAFTPGYILIACGIILSIIFVAIAMWASVRIRDKAKGIGLAIMLWLYFAVLFDTIVLFILFQFADYPIEKGMVAFSMLNPIDISRILILLQVDISALMGYTGAIFRNFFGTSIGMTITGIVLALWIFIPAWFSVRYFRTKDL